MIDVADARYQFVLAAQAEQTVLTIYDADGDPLSAELLNKLFPVMGQALSFRDVF